MTKEFAVIDLELKRARMVCETLGFALGSRLMSQIVERLGMTVLRLGSMCQFGNNRLRILLMYNHTAGELTQIAEYFMRMIEEEPFSVDGYRFQLTAQATVCICQLPPPATGLEPHVPQEAALRDRTDLRFRTPLQARMTLTAVHNIAVNVGCAPAKIMQLSSELIRFRTALKLPCHERMVIGIAARLFDREFTIHGRLIWSADADGYEHEYGLELLNQTSEEMESSKKQLWDCLRAL